jgi:hypothetical protein
LLIAVENGSEAVAKGFPTGSVMLGMRESHEDWLALGRDLIARGLGAPLLVVADGAPGLIKAVEQCWPASDRQHCAVHRVRNLLDKLTERERERVRQAYWQALDDATDEESRGRTSPRAGRGQRALERPEVRDLDPQPARARLGHEQDAPVRPGPPVLDGVGDGLRSGDHQIPRRLAVEAGRGRRLADD